MKICRLCGLEKDYLDFYRHSKMRDGRDSKCKECAKAGARGNYRKNIDHYTRYEKERAKKPERKARTLEYQRIRRHRDRVKYSATNVLNNAIRDGRAEKKPCEVCGEMKAEAHHKDYMNPLDVQWLCRKHHLDVHGKTERRKP